MLIDLTAQLWMTQGVPPVDRCSLLDVRHQIALQHVRV